MKNAAFLEVELESEDETFELPEFVNVIEDVTSDGRYTNAALARIDRERLPCEK
jgi:CYTH domain-containing protein